MQDEPDLSSNGKWGLTRNRKGSQWTLELGLTAETTRFDSARAPPRRGRTRIFRNLRGSARHGVAPVDGESDARICGGRPLEEGIYRSPVARAGGDESTEQAHMGHSPAPLESPERRRD
jgi:hypothetical protein